MNTPVQTYTRLTAPPSIALAKMAWALANDRALVQWPRRFEPTKRSLLERDENGMFYPVSREYYRIIDRITWSSHPDWNTPNWCPKCSPADIGYCRCEVACNE